MFAPFPCPALGDTPQCRPPEHSELNSLFPDTNANSILAWNPAKAKCGAITPVRNEEFRLAQIPVMGQGQKFSEFLLC